MERLEAFASRFIEDTDFFGGGFSERGRQERLDKIPAGRPGHPDEIAAAVAYLTAPEAGWHHDGRFNLLDLVRICEIEQSAERAADRIAPYADEDAP